MHKKQTICFQLETQFNIQRCTLHFPFTNNICTSKYNHLIEPKVEGQKVTSQPTIEETKVFEQEQINKELEEELDVTLNFLRITTTSIAKLTPHVIVISDSKENMEIRLEPIIEEQLQ